MIQWIQKSLVIQVKRIDFVCDLYLFFIYIYILFFYLGKRIFVCASLEDCLKAGINELNGGDETSYYTLEQWLQMNSFRWCQLEANQLLYVPANYIHGTSNVKDQYSVVVAFSLVMNESIPHLITYWKTKPYQKISNKQDAIELFKIAPSHYRHQLISLYSKKRKKM
jgi:hypothetical protein